MPIYTYQCGTCEGIFDIHHSMKETRKDCIECDASGSLVRIPATFSLSGSNTGKATTAKERVDAFISDAKKELEEHREDSRTDYEP